MITLLVSLCLSVLSPACSASVNSGTPMITEISCNGKENPLGVDQTSPGFSWRVSAESERQVAYQVVVASSPENLSDSRADMWNTGRVTDDQSSYVDYAGMPLQPMRKYWWKVRIWDDQGRVSDWSSAGTFQMGLFRNENWQGAKWIALAEDTRTSSYRFRPYKTGKMKAPVDVTSYPVGYFRDEILASKQIESASAFVCGLGYYELYINGEKVGDHVLDPAPSNYDQQAYYVTYDVSDQVLTGENALGLIVGNGFYGQNISWKNDPESERDLAYGQPSVRMLLRINYTDGTHDFFTTNEGWKATTGPIVFDNIYGGDTYDARFEISGWNEVGYPEENLQLVAVVHPQVNKISSQIIPPIRELKELDPQRVFKGADGEWIVDYGQNIAGWVEIKVKEKKGQLIDMIMTEALLTNGEDIFLGSTGGGANGMMQNQKYICKGEGIETWTPKFSYHGFRYVKIKGISTRPDKDMIKAILVATDIDEQGSFSSSDSLLNKMHTISKWTIVDNIHGIPEDCPHREKCGWLGDAHAFCEYALYNYDLDNFYKKYMVDISTQMRPVKGHNNPENKYRAPTMIAPGKRTSTIAKLDWGVATMYLPWYHYRNYGDSTIVFDFYDDMKVLTEYYLSFKNDQGIIDNGMGDWCPPRWDRRRNPGAMECDPVVSANAYFYDILGVMEFFAAMVGDDSFEQKMHAEQQSLYVAFNDAYLENTPATSYKWYGSQTATVMALQFGIVPQQELEAVLQGLVHDIKEVKDGHHSTGIHGNRYIYTVLTKYGKEDLAYELLTTPEFPSQTYIMNSGFTTWPERQFEWETMEGPTNSLNHPMHSGFSAYFFESLGGVKSTVEAPGYKVFTVDPEFPSAITETAISVPTPYGAITNEWKVEDGVLKMELEVPFNTQAELVLSEKELRTLEVNGESGINMELERLGSNIMLNAGKYEVQYVRD